MRDIKSTKDETNTKTNTNISKQDRVSDKFLNLFRKFLTFLRGTIVLTFCIVTLVFFYNATFNNTKIEYLIGDCVKVKDVDKPLMIIGYYQKNINTDEIYDYVGVLIPDGFLGEGYNFAFNNEDIVEVFNNNRQELLNYKTNLRDWFNEKSEVME